MGTAQCCTRAVRCLLRAIWRGGQAGQQGAETVWCVERRRPGWTRSGTALSLARGFFFGQHRWTTSEALKKEKKGSVGTILAVLDGRGEQAARREVGSYGGGCAMNLQPQRQASLATQVGRLCAGIRQTDLGEKLEHPMKSHTIYYCAGLKASLTRRKGREKPDSLAQDKV